MYTIPLSEKMHSGYTAPSRFKLHLRLFILLRPLINLNIPQVVGSSFALPDHNGEHTLLNPASNFLLSYNGRLLYYICIIPSQLTLLSAL